MQSTILGLALGAGLLACADALDEGLERDKVGGPRLDDQPVRQRECIDG
jgi:hypothetical protein